MENLPDIKEMTFTLWRRKWLFLTVMLIPAIIGYFIISGMPAKYKAASAILIEEQELKLANFQDPLSDSRYDEQTVGTQIGVITSETLALKTIEEAGLLEHSEFNPMHRKGTGFSAIADEGEANTQTVLKRFLSNLDVAPQGSSHVVRIGFLSESPELAAKVANLHTQNYIEYNKESMAARADALFNWLTKQVASLKAETQEKAQAVQAYRAKHGLVMGKDSEELIYQQISDTSAQLTPLETRRLELEARQETIVEARRTGSQGMLSQVIDSQLIQNLKTQQALAEQKLQMLSGDYGPRHPKLVAVRNEVREIGSKINMEIAMIANSTASELATVRQQENLLKAKLANLQEKADETRGDHVVLSTLESDLAASRKALDNAMVRLEDLRAQTNLSRSDAAVIAWANTPIEPAEPNKLLLFAVVLVLSGGLGLLAVFGVEVFQSGFNSLQEVKKVTGRTPLGILPFERNVNPDKMVSGYSIYSDAIKKIYMYGLMHKSKDSIGKCVLVSSAQPNEGKSTVVMSLAYYMASIGKKVLVVDTDINRPSLHTMTNTALRRGFSDLVTGNAQLADVIRRDSTGKLDVISAGSTKMLSPELWQSDQNQAIVAQMKQHYDFVLFDSPPLLALSDASALSALMDETLVVAQWAKTAQKQVAHIIEQIEAFSPKPIMGVVLTKVKIHQYATYDYGDAGIYYGANARYYSAATAT